MSHFSTKQTSGDTVTVIISWCIKNQLKGMYISIKPAAHDQGN